jgi:hypothetical protein
MAGRLDTSVLSTDLSEMISDLYTSVTGLGSNPVSAAVTDLAFEATLEVGGEVVTITQTLIVPASAIVARYSESADGVSYNIDVADITTG